VYHFFGQDLILTMQESSSL